jgi:putative transposase
MSKIARLVVPDCPHHIIQRGNRRQNVFFTDEDKRTYLNLLSENATKYGVMVWAYCLMNNHVHLIAVPKYEYSFSKALGQSHRRYATIINKRNGWSGHLWQSRFLSLPLSEKHLYAAIRYVENNPVRAGMVINAEQYEWSSARAHVIGAVDNMLTEFFLCNDIPDWAAFLRKNSETDDYENIRKCTRTGRPLDDGEFISEIESILSRTIKKKKPGPKTIK